MGLSHPIPSHPIPWDGWDGILLKSVPWDGMGLKFFFDIPSHGTKFFDLSHGTIFLSHGIPRGALFRTILYLFIERCIFHGESKKKNFELDSNKITNM